MSKNGRPMQTAFPAGFEPGSFVFEAVAKSPEFVMEVCIISLLADKEAF
jgi:hypothetical protein